MRNTKLPSKMKKKMQFKTQAVKNKQTKPQVIISAIPGSRNQRPWHPKQINDLIGIQFLKYVNLSVPILHLLKGQSYG